MIPLLKLLTISVKLFTKPAIARLKKSVYNTQNQFVKNIFIASGRRLARWEFYINRRFLNIHHTEMKPVNIGDEEAFDKSTEFLIEIVCLYGILGYLAISETINSVKKSKELKQQLLAIEGA